MQTLYCLSMEWWAPSWFGMSFIWWSDSAACWNRRSKRTHRLKLNPRGLLCRTRFYYSRRILRVFSVTTRRWSCQWGPSWSSKSISFQQAGIWSASSLAEMWRWRTVMEVLESKLAARDPACLRPLAYPSVVESTARVEAVCALQSTEHWTSRVSITVSSR